jgi:hypothetical protein
MNLTINQRKLSRKEREDIELAIALSLSTQINNKTDKNSKKDTQVKYYKDRKEFDEACKYKTNYTKKEIYDWNKVHGIPGGNARCHKVSSDILRKAANLAPDRETQRAIEQFSYSKNVNIRNQSVEMNKKHSKAERILNGTAKNPTQTEISWAKTLKSQKMYEAINGYLDMAKFDNPKKVEAVALIIKTLADESPLYAELLNDRDVSTSTGSHMWDKRTLNQDPIKKAIDYARNKHKDYTRTKTTKSKPTPTTPRTNKKSPSIKAKAESPGTADYPDKRRSDAAKKGWETRRKNELIRQQRKQKQEPQLRAATAEKQRRSDAAKKGWETRRKNELIRQQQKQKQEPQLRAATAEKQRRSDAAKKGWETRRKNELIRQQQKQQQKPQLRAATAEKQRRSDAAKKGWETRRKNELLQQQMSYGGGGFGGGGFGGGGFGGGGGGGGPRCADGSLDMRYKCNRGLNKFG